MKNQLLYAEFAASSVALSVIEILLSLRNMESHSLLEENSDSAEAIQGDGLIEFIDRLNSAT
jgi:hypothetical protein